MSDSLRLSSFEQLLEEEISLHSLSSADKVRLKDEYTSLSLVAKSQNQMLTQEDLFYSICTEEKSFRHIKRVLAFSLRFLSRTFNECIMESFFSKVKDTDEAGRLLKHETVEKLCFIRSNGPHPLVAKPLIRAALNEHFKEKGKGEWHFVTDADKFFISSSVTHQIEAAKKQFSLFD